MILFYVLFSILFSIVSFILFFINFLFICYSVFIFHFTLHFINNSPQFQTNITKIEIFIFIYLIYLLFYFWLFFLLISYLFFIYFLFSILHLYFINNSLQFQTNITKIKISTAFIFHLELKIPFSKIHCIWKSQFLFFN